MYTSCQRLAGMLPSLMYFSICTRAPPSVTPTICPPACPPFTQKCRWLYFWVSALLRLFQSATEKAPQPSLYWTLIVGLPSWVSSVLLRSALVLHDASLQLSASLPPL